MMQVKKKYSNRAFEEVKKAQMAANQKDTSQSIVQKKPTSAQKNEYVLPLVEIKHDLIKNLVFAGVSVVFLIVLSLNRFGYTQLQALLHL